MSMPERYGPSEQQVEPSITSDNFLVERLARELFAKVGAREMVANV